VTAVLPAEFIANAWTVASYPDGLLNAALSTDVYTAHITVRGVPVTVTGMECGMTWAEVDETGRLIYSLPLDPGVHVFIEGPGRVRVGASGPVVTTFDQIVAPLKEAS